MRLSSCETAGMEMMPFKSWTGKSQFAMWQLAAVLDCGICIAAIRTCGTFSVLLQDGVREAEATIESRVG